MKIKMHKLYHLLYYSYINLLLLIFIYHQQWSMKSLKITMQYRIYHPSKTYEHLCFHIFNIFYIDRKTRDAKGFEPVSKTSRFPNFPSQDTASPSVPILSFETALEHVNCARSHGLKFVARHGDPWGLHFSLAFRSTSVRSFVRSLGSFVGFVLALSARSAPVVEVDPKVGVLSREKGVSRAPVSPPSSGPPAVIPNFLREHTRFPLLEDDAPESSGLARVWYARHYSRANTLDLKKK